MIKFKIGDYVYFSRISAGLSNKQLGIVQGKRGFGIFTEYAIDYSYKTDEEHECRPSGTLVSCLEWIDALDLVRADLSEVGGVTTTPPYYISNQ